MSADGPDPSGDWGRGRVIIDQATGEPAEVVGGALKVTGASGPSTNDQGAPNTPANAWPVKATDAAGVNQSAITAAGDTKVTLDGEIVGVTGPLTDAELRATPVPVSGDFTSDGLTDAELRATPVPVSGTVSVTEPVSVDDNGGSLTVDGPLTDTELRATPVPVSGPLTDTQLRATPVPVSGTVTASGPLTDTQLRATPVPVSGTGSDNTANSTAKLPVLPAVYSAGGGTIGNMAPLSVRSTDGALIVATDTSSGVTAVGGSVEGDTPSAALNTLPAISSSTESASLTNGRMAYLRLTTQGWLRTKVSDWLGSTAPTVGQKVMASSLPVVIASDQSAVPVSGPLTDTQLRASAVPVTIAANSAVNVAQIAGTATAVDIGIPNAGTQRVIVAQELTYRAATTDFAAAASTAVFFVIYGSSTKTLRVRKLRVSGGSKTALAYLLISLIKYSTAPSGGTSTDRTQVPLDSNDAAGTASLVKAYTAAPTDGSIVGLIGSVRTIVKATTTVDGAEPFNIEWDFGDRGVVLRGTTQGVGLSFPTAPATAVTLAVEVEWSEE